MYYNLEVNNLQIAELLRDVAASYQLQDKRSLASKTGKEKNKFKIIAYERAATAIEHASSELKDLWDEGKLKDVPSVGEAIAEHLDELFRTGHVQHFEDLAFTEHNPSKSRHSEKEIVEILKIKREKVDKFSILLSDNINYSGVKKVFNGLEIDILPDGSCPIFTIKQ